VSEEAPIRPFPSRRMFEPKYMAETWDLSMTTVRAAVGRRSGATRLHQIHHRMVDAPLRREYERGVAQLRSHDLPVVIGDTVGDWLFSCTPGAGAEAICRAVGMTQGFYADLSLPNEELVMKRFSNAMPRSVRDWATIRDVIRMVIGDCQSVVFIFRDAQRTFAPALGRFGLFIKEAVEELLPLRGPVAMVLEGWEEPFLSCPADAFVPSTKKTIQMPVRPLSLKHTD
jgi:hypothetical protein